MHQMRYRQFKSPMNSSRKDPPDTFPSSTAILAATVFHSLFLERRSSTSTLRQSVIDFPVWEGTAILAATVSRSLFLEWRLSYSRDLVSFTVEEKVMKAHRTEEKKTAASKTNSQPKS